MITEAEFERANRRGRATQAKTPRVREVRYDRRTGRVVIHLQSNLDITFAPGDVQGLEGASPSQLAEIEMSPSGLGLHFPKLDADIYLPALLQGFTGSRKWMASRMGAEGGKSKSLAKKQASRTNGKLGGRPRKVA